jgi:glycerol-3-phosphate dehydrogenase
MGKIDRDPVDAARASYDLIIIGGGVYGIMLSLEASRRKLRSLLVERNDFGGATSFNSLRIIHGGLRYLQSFDLHRFHESVRERQWFLKTFPDLVKPLPCLMPLYGEALRYPFVLRVALYINDCLSFKRNRSVKSDGHIPPGKIISESETREIFPQVDPVGLKGGAVWYDALMPDSQRILIETLRYTSDLGVTALNYVEAKHLINTNNAVEGIIAVDRETGTSYEFKSNVVVNTAGPWCRDIAKAFDRDEPSLFRSSLAWNVLFKREALSDFGLAVTPRNPTGQTYFILPYKGLILAGTGHGPSSGICDDPVPPEEQLLNFINELNRAMPGLELRPQDILHIYSGYLPAKEEFGTELTTREVILDHGKNGGPSDFHTVSGIKFTTSRLVAEKVLNRIFPHQSRQNDIDPQGEISLEDQEKRGIYDQNWFPDIDDENWKNGLKKLIEEESVMHLDDLILRRTNLGDNPVRAMKIAPLICELFKWDSSRTVREIRKLKTRFDHIKFS